MVFSSSIFLFYFLPITLIVYALVPKRFKNLVLFIASFVFYAWGGVQYALMIVASSLVNYAFGLAMGTPQQKSEKTRKALLVADVVFNLGLLAFFKYFNFFTANIEALINLFTKSGFTFNAPLIPLPIGISFFTFQIMSYTIDVYRGSVKPQKNALSLSLYVMLFPQLIAGPIVRYIDVETEINSRTVTLNDIRDGAERFVLGFAKKILFANSMGAVADSVFNKQIPSLVQLNTPIAWVGIICYALQIYFDFAAYSDMAIGLGRMFGFHFHENFNHPYIASSVQDFWRRWHISLSSWLKDYVYIPLGGSRCGKFKTYRNSIIVFFLTGLWHGASWSFVIWGLWHGAFLILERAGFNKVLKKLPKALGHIYTLLVVLVGWVFFRADTLTDAVKYLGVMFGFNFKFSSYVLCMFTPYTFVMLLLAVLFSAPTFAWCKAQLAKRGTLRADNIIYNIAFALLFAVSICIMSGSSYNPFIYFRF